MRSRAGADGVFAELGDLTAETGHALAAPYLEPESASDVEAEFWKTDESPPLRHRGLRGLRWGGAGRRRGAPRDEIVDLIAAEAAEGQRRDPLGPVPQGEQPAATGGDRRHRSSR